MSIALVQQKVTAWASGASIAASVTSTPTNGNLLVLFYNGGSNGVTVNSITQTGATWVRATRSITARTAEIWYAENVSGAGTAITVSLSGTSALAGGVAVSEWSGIVSSSSLDASGTAANSGNSVSPATATVTPTAGREAVVFAASRLGGAVSAGPTGGFTALTAQGIRDVSAYQLVASTSGSYAAGWTQGSGTWEACIATFFAPSSGPTGAVTGTAVAAAAAQELLAGGAVGVSLATASAQDLVAAVATGIATAAASGQELAMGVAIGSAVSTADAQELLGATAVGIASLSADSAGNGGAVSGTASLAASALELLLGAVVGDGTVQATADSGSIAGTGGRGGYLHELRWRKKLEEAEEAARIAEQAEIDAIIAEQQATSHASIAAKAAAREARIVARAAAAEAKAAEAEAERIRAEKQLLDDEDDIRLVYWLTAY